MGIISFIIYWVQAFSPLIFVMCACVLGVMIMNRMQDQFEWHATGGNRMRRRRRDGTWEYREMTDEEYESSQESAQW